MSTKRIRVAALLGGLAAATPSLVAAAEQPQSSPSPGVDGRINTLLSDIENGLGDNTKSSALAEMLLSVQALLPSASPETQQRAAEFPGRLLQRADTARQTGDIGKSISYSVFANVARSYLASSVAIGPKLATETSAQQTTSPNPAPEAPAPQAASPEPTPAPPAPQAAGPQPTPVPPQQAKAEPFVSPDEKSATERLAVLLVQRGDALLKQGDVAAARMLYGKAVDLGLGSAAVKLGDTYNGELTQQNLRGGDPLKAGDWYHKAQSMGVTPAQPVPKNKPRQDTSVGTKSLTPTNQRLWRDFQEWRQTR